MDEILKQAGGILASVAPTIANMIGGPFAGQAVAALEAALGIEPTGDKNKALAAVATATPDQLLVLKAEDNRHAEALEKMGIDRETLAAQDRDSARKREMAVKDHIPAILAVLTMASFFGYIAVVTFWPERATNKEFISLAIGWLGGIASAVISYYFGSSSGSARKDELLAQKGF